MSDDEKSVQAPVVRRVRRRRKRPLKSRIKKFFKTSGTDKRVYIVAAGVVAIVLGIFLYDLLFAVFPLKGK
jgi:hypothetical protein